MLLDSAMINLSSLSTPDGLLLPGSSATVQSACSMGPTYMNASSEKVIPFSVAQFVQNCELYLPIGVISPGFPVNTSATRKRLRQESLNPPSAMHDQLVFLTQSSSTPRMAMMSCSSRYRCSVVCTRRAQLR